jgi:hypothetical protein
VYKFAPIELCTVPPHLGSDLMLIGNTSRNRRSIGHICLDALIRLDKRDYRPLRFVDKVPGIAVAILYFSYRHLTIGGAKQQLHGSWQLSIKHLEKRHCKVVKVIIF